MVFSWLLGIAILVAVLVLIVIYYYNRFAVLANRIQNSLSQIDVQLKKRADLVPNVLETVKAYAKHEKSIIADVTNARKALVGASTLSKRAKAGAELQSALGSLFAIAENYPQLRSNENFLNLQQQLAEIEDRIAYARQYYNDAILSYNNLCTTVPGVWFARTFSHSKKEFLQIPSEERAVPKIKF